MNLRKTLTVRIALGSLRNWSQAISFMAGRSRKSKIDLLFRDGGCIEEVNDPSLASALLNYYYYSRLIGSYSLEDMQKIKVIGEDISDKLNNNFSPREIREFSMGGSFHLKEVLLFSLIRKLQPEIVVETGVAQGISSYTILSALRSNTHGKLISVDFPNYNAKGYEYDDGTVDPVFVRPSLGSGWLVPSAYSNLWDLRIGKSKNVLPTLDVKVDIFLHDSEHSYHNMIFEFEWAYSHLSPRGVIVSDDIDWNGAFSDFVGRHADMKLGLSSRTLGISFKTDHP